MAGRTWRGFPSWLWGCAAVWGVLLVVWLPVGEVFVPRGSSPVSRAYLPVGCLIGAALAWTVLWGGLLGYRRAWREVLLSAPAGTALLLGLYATAVLMSPPPDDWESDGSDNASIAGAGVARMAVPTLLSMALLLALGAGIGCCVRAVRERRRAAVTAT